MGIALTPDEQLEVFGTDRLDQYHAEAETRWGESDPWKESQRRAATYTKDDWVAIQVEAEANTRAFADALAAGEPADGTTAMDLAEAHHGHISRWFYRCGYDMHCRLAEMFVADPRFRATYDDVTPGLATYIHDAIVANATRARVGA
jgi:MerR family transcriptional regulator, thiopeptide resistance regulator